MGIASRTLLIRVTLPPKEKYCHFQFDSLFIFLRTSFQMVTNLCFSPKGSPKYFVGREPITHWDACQTVNIGDIVDWENGDFCKINTKTINSLKNGQNHPQEQKLLFLSFVKDQSVISVKNMRDFYTFRTPEARGETSNPICLNSVVYHLTKSLHH